MSTEQQKERIAKRIARAGVASRRDAEAMIMAGRVILNGEKLNTAATLVNDTDTILIDGKPLNKAERTRLWRYNKPKGLVTTNRDERGRITIFDKLPSYLPRIMTVGRLDLTSEGLLLLTNDGGLARALEHPSRGWTRRYRARVFGLPTPNALAALKNGVTVDGITFGSINAVVEEGDKNAGRSNIWLSVTLKEGKNREVRKALEFVGHPVSRLIRTAYGPFQLGKLQPGEVEETPTKVLKEQLGSSASEFKF
ncbi:MAG: pseudouridine synthase [Rhodospirillales bacterium]